MSGRASVRAGHSRPRALAAALHARARVFRDRGQGLVDRPGRKAEVRRAPIRVTEPRQRIEQRPLEILTERGSQATQRGCSSPIDGVMIDWCAPPSGASVTPDGCRRGSIATGVHAERPRLERPVDKRVVQRSDRQRACPSRDQVARARRAGRQGCPPRYRARCAGRARSRASERARVGVVGEPVDPLAEMPDAGAVDPAAEVGRRGHVGADRDHVRRDLWARRARVDEEAPERLLGRCPAVVRPTEVARRGGRWARRRRMPLQRPCRRRAHRARVRAGSNLAHGSAGSAVSRASSPICSSDRSAE